MKNFTRSNGDVDDPCIYKVVTHVAFEACLLGQLKASASHVWDA